MIPYRMIALVLVVALLLTAVTPARAEALEVGTILLLVGVGVIVVIIVAYLVVASVKGRQMAAAQERLRDEGLWIDDIRLGSPDPLAAVHDAVNFESFADVIVCTLPRRISRWLKLCLPHRVQRSTGLPVTHIVAQRSRSGRFERVAEPVPAPIAA